MKREKNKYPNLIPNCERSHEELREMGRKGGIKSGESRRRKRDLQKSAKMWLKVFEELEKQGVNTDEVMKKLEGMRKK